MSKPNTFHIIGFDVQQHPVTVPSVVDVTNDNSVYVVGVFDVGVFE